MKGILANPLLAFFKGGFSFCRAKDTERKASGLQQTPLSRGDACESEVGRMRLSARNMLKGKVKSVNHGAVNTEVVVELPGGLEVVSVITKASAENLGLAEGKEVYAVIKATNVMIGVD